MKTPAFAGIAALAFAAGPATGRFTAPVSDVPASRPAELSRFRFDGVLGKPAVFRSRWNLKFGGATTLRADTTPGGYVFTLAAADQKRTATYHYPLTEEEAMKAGHNFDGYPKKVSTSEDGRTLFKLTYSFGAELSIRGGNFQTLLLLLEKDGRFSIYPDLEDEGVFARNPNVLGWSEITIDWRGKEPVMGVRYVMNSGMDANTEDVSVYSDYALSTVTGELRPLGTPYLLGHRGTTLKDYAARLDAYYDFTDNDLPVGTAERWLGILEKSNPKPYVSDGMKVRLPADFATIAHTK